MMQRIRQSMGKLNNNQGFTLVEMALVLIIIGIIIGAVVKGKDVMKSAEQKRLYTTFIREWQVAYNNYYDRTGMILGDTDTVGNTGTRDGLCSLATGAHLVSQLSRVGLTPPAQGPTGASNVRTYTDAMGRQYTLTLVFANNTNVGNHIRITGTPGVPFDLGMAWDRIIDETADGNLGDMLYTSDVTGTGVNDWPANISTATPSTGNGIYLRMEF